MKKIILSLFLYCALGGQSDKWTETLIYNAYFGGIYVAESQLKIDVQNTGGDSVIHILFQAKTKSVADYIFPINDKISIDVNSKRWTPKSIKKVIREGEYQHDSFTQLFPEKNIILSTINKLFRKKKYLNLKNSNYFTQYNENMENTQKISSICDGRVIWGGDKTINEVRKIWIPERPLPVKFEPVERPDPASKKGSTLESVKKIRRAKTLFSEPPLFVFFRWISEKRSKSK